MNEELVKGSGCLHAKGWEWNLHITHLSLSDLPKPHRMSLKVNETARSSHRSHAHVWTRTICLSSLNGDPLLSLMLSCTDISRSPCLDVSLFQFVFVSLWAGFVSSFLFHIYCTINITWFQQDLMDSSGIRWSSCRIGPWITNVCGHLLTWSWLITRPIL